MIAGSHVMMWVGSDPTANDACRFALNSRSLLIEGSNRTTAGAQRYRVRAGRDFITRRVRLDGVQKHLIERSLDGAWMLDGVDVPEVEEAKDIDLAFTPATNTLAIRRLALPVGQTADVMAAWFDTADRQLKPLRQTYSRLAEYRYLYTAPDQRFEVELTVDDFGAVTHYPGHWEARG